MAIYVVKQFPAKTDRIDFYVCLLERAWRQSVQTPSDLKLKNTLSGLCSLAAALNELSSLQHQQNAIEIPTATEGKTSP